MFVVPHIIAVLCSYSFLKCSESKALSNPPPDCPNRYRFAFVSDMGLPYLCPFIQRFLSSTVSFQMHLNWFHTEKDFSDTE